MRQKTFSVLEDIDYPLPVILDAGWVNGLGIIRDLGREDIRSVALSHKPDAIGLNSKFSYGYSCPNPAIQPAEFVDFLINLGKRLRRKGIFLLSDDTYLLSINQAREDLSEYYEFTFPENSILLPLMDKSIQLETAARLGVPVPHSWFPGIDHREYSWPDSAFPAIVKGRSGKKFSQSYGRQVLITHSYKELREALDKYSEIGVIVQEIIPGGDDHLYTYGSCINRQGKLVAAFTGQKLRQNPEGFGVCRHGVSLACPDIVDNSLKLLRELKFYGVSQVEYKLDPRDGKYKLIEINGRFWMWHSLAAHCGVNLSAAAYLSAIGASTEKVVHSQRYGIGWKIGSEDLLYLLREIFRKRFTWGKFMDIFSFSGMDAKSDWRDPLPEWKYWLSLPSQVLKKKHTD